MLLNKHEKEFKHALKIVRELNELCRQRNSIDPIKLDKPIQHGYVRSFELTNDAKYRSDYEKLVKAFNLLGQVKAYHHSEDFKYRVGKSRKKFEKHAILLSFRDPRYSFYMRESDRERDIQKVDELKKWLIYHNSVYVCACGEYNNTQCKKSFIPHYTFRYKWLIKEVTKPNILTHYTPLDGELESRIAKLNKEMYNKDYYKLLYNNNNSYDKIYNTGYLSMKYDTDRNVIYHSLEDHYE